MLIGKAIRVSAFLAAAALAAFSVNSAPAVLIDDFSVGALHLQAATYSPGSTAQQQGLSSSAVVGGARGTYAGSARGLATLDIDTASSRFVFSAADSSGYFRLTYGATTPLNLDLFADGAMAFALNFDELTPGLWRGIYELVITAEEKSARYNFSQALFALGGSGTVHIPFAAFPSLDLTRVSRIVVDAGRVEPLATLSITSIETIPEPQTLFLEVLAVGFIGLRLIRARRAGRWPDAGLKGVS